MFRYYRVHKTAEGSKNPLAHIARLLFPGFHNLAIGQMGGVKAKSANHWIKGYQEIPLPRRQMVLKGVQQRVREINEALIAFEEYCAELPPPPMFSRYRKKSLPKEITESTL